MVTELKFHVLCTVQLEISQNWNFTFFALFNLKFHRIEISCSLHCSTWNFTELKFHVLYTVQLEISQNWNFTFFTLFNLKLHRIEISRSLHFQLEITQNWNFTFFTLFNLKISQNWNFMFFRKFHFLYRLLTRELTNARRFYSSREERWCQLDLAYGIFLKNFFNQWYTLPR
jgi:hypothetical protein